MPDAVRTFFAEITGSSAGLVRAAGQGEAASSSLERKLGTVGSGMGAIGQASATHIGGTSVKNVSLLDRAFDPVVGKVKGLIGSIASMAGQTAGFGALFGGAAVIGVGIKDAETFNQKLAAMKLAFQNAGMAIPQAQINTWTQSLERQGIIADDTASAITTMVQAHIPLVDMQATLQNAADLSAAKNIDLASSLKAVIMGAQGSGRALMEYGINLPVTVPKAAAMAAAQHALAKAQEAYNAALNKYTTDDPHVVAAHARLLDAQSKVKTMTAEVTDHFENLAQVNTVLQQRFGGTAAAMVAADPMKAIGVQVHAAEIAIGQGLMPTVSEFALWIEGHGPQIQDFAHHLGHDLGVAAKDTAGFIKNDLLPPVKDVLGWIGDHKQAVIDTAAALAGLYTIGKVKSAAGSVIGDLKSLFGAGGSVLNVIGRLTGLWGAGGGAASGLGGVGGLAPVHVWVDNPGFGAGGPGVAPVAAGEGAAAVGGVTAAGLGLTGLRGFLGKVAGGLGFNPEFDVQMHSNLQQILDDARLQRNYMDHQAQSLTASLSIGQAFHDAGINAGSMRDAVHAFSDLVIQGKITAQPQVDAFEKAWKDGVRNTNDLTRIVGEAARNAAPLPGAVDAAMQAWRASVTALDAMNASMPGSPFAHPARAAGGSAAGRTVVGEHGPEVVDLPPGSFVHPNFGSIGKGGAQGSGGEQYISVSVGQIVVQGAGDPKAVAMAVRDILLSQMARGAVPQIALS